MTARSLTKLFSLHCEAREKRYWKWSAVIAMGNFERSGEL
jgi:hypothetical protein